MNQLFPRTSKNYLSIGLQGLILAGLLSMVLSCGGGSGGDDEFFLGGPGVAVSFMSNFIGGEYIITATATSVSETVFSGKLGGYFSLLFGNGTDLAETLYIPDLAEVKAHEPGGVPVTYPLKYIFKFGDLELTITRENDNPFFTALGDAEIGYGTCSATGKIYTGSITPTSPSTVNISAVIEDITVSEPCFGLPGVNRDDYNPDGTITISLTGRLF